MQALLLENVQFWDVSRLELTNDKKQPGDYRGILVRGKDVGVLRHIYIRDYQGAPDIGPFERP